MVVIRQREMLGCLGAVFGVLLWITPAFADFKIVEDKPSPAQASSPPPAAKAPPAPGLVALPDPGCQPGVAMLRGAPSAMDPLLTPGGHEPAAAALRRVLPKGWTIRGAVEDTPVIDWTGGGTWLDVIHDIGQSAGLCLNVDFDRRVVQVERVPLHTVKAVVEPSRPETVNAGDKDTTGQVVKTVPLDAGPGQAPVSHPKRLVYSVDDDGQLHAVFTNAPDSSQFKLVSGSTLRETLTKWAHTAGWQLVWHSNRDYPIAVNMAFDADTSFQEAVATVLKAYWKRDSALVGRVYKNRVLEIVGRL